MGVIVCVDKLSSLFPNPFCVLMLLVDQLSTNEELKSTTLAAMGLVSGTGKLRISHKVSRVNVFLSL